MIKLTTPIGKLCDTSGSGSRYSLDHVRIHDMGDGQVIAAATNGRCAVVQIYEGEGDGFVPRELTQTNCILTDLGDKWTNGKKVADKPTGHHFPGLSDVFSMADPDAGYCFHAGTLVGALTSLGVTKTNKGYNSIDFLFYADGAVGLSRNERQGDGTPVNFAVINMVEGKAIGDYAATVADHAMTLDGRYVLLIVNALLIKMADSDEICFRYKKQARVTTAVLIDAGGEGAAALMVCCPDVMQPGDEYQLPPQPRANYLLSTYFNMSERSESVLKKEAEQKKKNDAYNELCEELGIDPDSPTEADLKRLDDVRSSAI